MNAQMKEQMNEQAANPAGTAAEDPRGKVFVPKAATIDEAVWLTLKPQFEEAVKSFEGNLGRALTDEEKAYVYDRVRGQFAGQNWDTFQQNMRGYTMANRIPYKGTFELTARCSLKCKMCYVRLDPEDVKAQGRELTTAEWMDMAKLAFDAGTVDLLVTGGEPMLRPDFAELYTAFTDMGFLLHVFTNATLVTPEIIALFTERPPQEVEVTIYGASRETYERVAGWADGFDRMMEGLDAMLGIGLPIQLKATIVRENAGDFEAIRKIAHDRGLQVTTTTTPMPAIRGAKADVRAHRLNLGELLTFHKKHAFDIVNSDCASPPLDARVSLYCDAGLSSYAILWNGDMVACCTDPDPACPKGRPLEEGFDAVWARLKDFRCNKPLPEPCKTCPVYAMCSTCAAHHFAETGSYDKHQRYGCDFYRIQAGLQVLRE